MKKIALFLLILLTACAPTAPSTFFPTEQPKPSLHGDLNTAQPAALLPSNTVQLIDVGGAVLSTSATIQPCLDVVKAGQKCLVGPGAYNEALVMKTTGTVSQRITIQCETQKGCTVNSGNARTIVTQGQNGFYTIDGFRFIGTAIETGDHPSFGSTINFSFNEWWDGYLGERGNDGFILRNCYVEGTVWIYGSDNIIENCEFNGRGNWSNAITEAYAPSENNIFRNNIIHDYQIRGGWSLQMTRNTLWEGNTVFNIWYPPNHDWQQGLGIDCDGAGSAVFGCNVKGNTIYNVSEAAILLENTFDSVIENNTVRDSRRGISVINYNKENGDGFNADKDYKGLMTNTIIRNNTIYNIQQDGVLCKAVRGNQFLNNTISNVSTSPGFFGAIAFATYTGFDCPDWIVTGNTVINSPKTVWFEGDPPITMDNNSYGIFSANINNGASVINFAQWQALGKDTNSTIGGVIATPTRTRTVTPTVTLLPTFTPTRTPTGSPAPIPPSVTPSRTATPSLAPSSTLTFSPVAPTVTRTPTRIPTKRPTRTRTPTPTATPPPILLNGTPYFCARPCRIEVP